MKTNNKIKHRFIHSSIHHPLAYYESHLCCPLSYNCNQGRQNRNCGHLLMPHLSNHLHDWADFWQLISPHGLKQFIYVLHNLVLFLTSKWWGYPETRGGSLQQGGTPWWQARPLKTTVSYPTPPTHHIIVSSVLHYCQHLPAVKMEKSNFKIRKTQATDAIQVGRMDSELPIKLFLMWKNLWLKWNVHKY